MLLQYLSPSQPRSIQLGCGWREELRSAVVAADRELQVIGGGLNGRKTMQTTKYMGRRPSRPTSASNLETDCGWTREKCGSSP